MKKIIFRTNIFLLLCAVNAFLLTACDEEDPFVDRTVSPVLLVFDEVTGYLAGGGLTAVPSVTKSVTASNVSDPVVLSVTVYELDKSGILDNTVGIDSIPLSDFQLTFSKRDGTSTPIEATSDASGKISISTTWESLGITDAQAIADASEARSIVISLSWTGTYKDQSFTRYSQVVFSKASS